MTKEIKTEIIINAPVQRVWKVLTDFDNYPFWNPFITSVKGNVAKGERITVRVGGMTFKPIVLNFEREKEIRWLGHFVIKGLFDGEHIFQLIDNGDNTTTFKQNEIFRGLLVRFYLNHLEEEIKPGFELMNRIIRNISETEEITNVSKTENLLV